MDTLLGRYEIVEVISRSDDRTFAKAVDRSGNRIVALKIVRVRDDTERLRAVQEASLLLDIPAHHGLPTARFDFADGEQHVIVLDWVDGNSLEDVLMQRGDPGLPVPEVIGYISQAAETLDHLHRQSPPVVHGDVKPANLILTPAGRIVLVDFGASVRSGGIATAGSPGYIAPEVAAGRPIGIAADVYGLAASAVTLLTGRPPDGRRPIFEGINPADVDHLTRTLRRALATDPEQRTASASAFAGALAADAAAPWTGRLTLLLLVAPGDPDVESGSAHADAVERLDEILSNAVASHGGRLIGSMSHGYRRWAAFGDSTAAVAAAQQVHRAIAVSHWPPRFPAGLAAVLDSGAVSYRDGNYTGEPIARVSRLAGRVPPGATLLTAAAAQSVSDVFPDDWVLKPVATSQDGHAGQQLFALLRPDSPGLALLSDRGVTPPGAAGRFLPVRSNSFVGREAEVTHAARVLTEQRLCAITGPVGVGKSRLALQVASRLQGEFPGGTCYADVQRRSPSERLPTLLAAVLGLVDSGSGTYAGTHRTRRSATDRVCEYLQDQQVLIVLDNADPRDAELDELAPLAADLLTRCPGVKVLVTARQASGLDQQTRIRLRPLPTPAVDCDPDTARTAPAVQLFLDRAATVRPGLDPDADAIGLVGELCRAVDGSPLAIELLAARLAFLSLPALADTMAAQHSGRTMDMAGNDAEAAMRATIRASIEALTPDERAVFVRLSVFAGAFTLTAATAVCAARDRPPARVGQLLAGLVDKSLVELEVTGSEQRFRLLAAFRREAEQLLDGLGSGEDARSRHRAYFHRHTEQIGFGLQGSEQSAWMAQIDADLANILLAVDRALSDDADAAILMVARLAPFWLVRGRISEAKALLRRALAVSAQATPRATAIGWLALTSLACFAGDVDEATVAARRARTACLASQQPELIAWSAVLLGQAALLQFSPAAALSRNQAAVAAARSSGHQELLALALTNLGVAELRAGLLEAATSSLEQAAEIRETNGDHVGLTWTRLRLGMARTASEEFDAAADQLSRALHHARLLRYGTGTLLATLCLADLHFRQGDHVTARDEYDQAVQLSRASRDEAVEALALSGLVQIAAASNDRDAAGDLLSRLEELPSSDLPVAAAQMRSRAAVAESQGLLSAAAGHRRAALLVHSQLLDRRGVTEQLIALGSCAERFGRSELAGEVRAAAATAARGAGFRVAEGTTIRSAAAVGMRVSRG